MNANVHYFSSIFFKTDDANIFLENIIKILPVYVLP